MTITYSGGITFNGGFYTASPPPTYSSPYGIFGYGNISGTTTTITNLVSNTGTVATDTAGVGTARWFLAACGYGLDKGIFGFGDWGGGYSYAINKVSNSGIVASNTTITATARSRLAACGYGSGKGMFAYGYASIYYNLVNTVSDTGTVATDTTSPGVARYGPAGASYGGDKAIIGYGNTGTYTEVTIINLISNTGVIADDSAGAGTARTALAACSYGNDKCIFGYGFNNELSNDTPYSLTNLVSNTGVVATDTAGVGTTRYFLAACSYGLDKGIFGYGSKVVGGSTTPYSLTNKVSNTGVVATDTTGVGTARNGIAACGYG